MSESFAMGESSLQGMRDTGSRTGETVFRYPATRVIPPGRHGLHLWIDRGERRRDLRTKCFHPATNGRRRGNSSAQGLHRVGAWGPTSRCSGKYMSLGGGWAENIWEP